MKYAVLSFGMALTLGGCGTIGDSFYNGQAITECEEIFDPARASDCRLNQVESRQVRRSERRNDKEKD
ncbi:MAG: hypothetical protein AAF950_04775 [Pseudomonadota bacterium]